MRIRHGHPLGALDQLAEKLYRLCTGELYVANDESGNTAKPVVDTTLGISQYRAEVEFRLGIADAPYPRQECRGEGGLDLRVDRRAE